MLPAMLAAAPALSSALGGSAGMGASGGGTATSGVGDVHGPTINIGKTKGQPMSTEQMVVIGVSVLGIAALVAVVLVKTKKG